MNPNKDKPHKILPKTFFLIFLIVALLVIAYSVLEQNQSKKELLLLMNDQAKSLLETTLSASQSSLISYEEIENEIKERLLNNANFIKLLLEKDGITNKMLEQIGETNNVFRINIFNQNGIKLFTNHKPTHTNIPENFSPSDFLSPIFNGIEDTLFLGIKEARFEEGSRFAIALATKKREAIVLNLDAEELLAFRKKIGLGALLKNLTSNKNIEYAILQDSSGIIAASGNLSNVPNLDNASFFSGPVSGEAFSTRLIESDSLQIFEAFHSFTYKGEFIGYLRLGLDAEALTNLTARSSTRILITGLVLFLLGSILLAYVFTKQNFEHLKKDYRIIEDYSEQIILNVSDSIIVLDEFNRVKTFNTAAVKLFNKTSDEVIGQNLELLIDKDNFNEIISSDNTVSPMELRIDGLKKFLLFSKSNFEIEENKQNTILVIRDISKIKSFEDQLQRKERLVAMGELASGVAHEIRNPLNTISTITQQLAKDFIPKENDKEYYELANLVHKEVIRINNTIKDFLRFARPEKIIFGFFNLKELIDQIEKQYHQMFIEKNIKFRTSISWTGEVNWDRNQIQQVLMNLIQNSYDAILTAGNITLKVENNMDQIIITIQDNGIGMPIEMTDKIFNLYFTTKSNGTGIGLSIVQRIIYEHKGIVEVESEQQTGTKFLLNIPINPLMV
jgi:PAS domain S-box-containing protein